MSPHWKRALFFALAGSLLAVLLALFGRPAGFSVGAWLLSLLAVLALTFASRWAGAGRGMAWVVAAAFLLRLGLGVGLAHALPVWGYDEREANAGYLFFDAYERDQQAWQWAESGQPLWQAFSGDLQSDQYGGLLALCAGVYRFLSPDQHRPYLILILGALAAGLGVPFLWRALQPRWGPRVAWLGCLVYAFYPEAVLQGASQMREPFIMGLTAIAFWAVNAETTRPSVRWIPFAGSMLALGLISSRVEVPVLAVLFGWWWLLRDRMPSTRARRTLVWVAMGWVILGIIIYSYAWLRSSAAWDALLTERASGWMQLIIETVGKRYRVPVFTLYGLAQPLLPGALIETAIPLARAISVFRAVGWYLLLPVLAYGLLASIRQTKTDRRLALFAALVVWAWVLIASVRAGGDAWDNPRYRTHLMVVIAFLAAWAWETARARNSVWLKLLFGLTGSFVLVLSAWYLDRYQILDTGLSFGMSAALIGLSWLALIGYGIFAQRRKRFAQPASS
jgi:hypothetical protein